jgi:hypothetical protein
VDVTEMADERTPAIGEFMQIVLSDEYGSSLSQAANNLCIFRRNSILVQRARRGRTNACGIDQVFERNRNSMQWSPPLPT